MKENNTLFILAKWGLKSIRHSGIFESHMWILTDEETSMKYVSLHKSKATEQPEAVKLSKSATQPKKKLLPTKN